MVNLTIEEKHKELYDFEITREYAIKLKPLKEIKENEKISIMSDVMFKTLFCNSKRLKYGAKFLSFYIDVPYEEILKNIKLSKTELDNEAVTMKEERCDYVAILKNTLLNIEVNCNSSKETMQRNIEYAFRQYASNIKVGSKYEYTKVIQFNLNNFSMKDNDKIIDIYSLQNDANIRLVNDIIIVQIYVPNIRKKCYNEGIENLLESERFILSLAETNKEDADKVIEGDDFMEELVKDQVTYGMDVSLRNSYDHEQAMKDWGYEEGQKDTIKKSAIEFHKNGVSDDIIMKSLHITKEELQKYLEQK